MHLFLDLEDTLIRPVLNGWYNVEFIDKNIEKIKQLAKSAEHVNIFSFAIWQHDLQKFSELALPAIESRLGRAITRMIPTIDEIREIVCQRLGLVSYKTDFSDLCDFLGKGGCFEHFVLHKNIKQSILVDDAVVDKSMIVWDKGIPVQITLINVDTM